MGKRIIFLSLFTLLGIGFITYKVTYAFFSSGAASTGNIFAAASVFPSPSFSPSASASASASPSGSPSSSPSATPAPSATANIFVSDPYTCATGASIQDTLRGTVSFVFNTSTLDLTVNLSSASPSTTYDIWVNQDPGGCPLSSPTFPGGVITDGSGNGSNTFSGLAKVSGATNFWISAVAGTDVFRSLAVSP